MTAERQGRTETDRERVSRDDEQGVIEEVGKEGTVATHGGETSLGTTPIGTGSVEPVGGHREASDRIMGEDEGEDRRNQSQT